MLQDLRVKRFSAIQALIGFVVIAVTSVLMTRTAMRQPPEAKVEREALPLMDRFGPARNSYGPEEWIVRDFFNDKRDGFFVDIGANHYRITSNTYYLETGLHWSGLAVEPLKQFEADYVKFRPRTRFLPFFVSDTSNQRAKMYVLEKNTQVASADRAFTEQQGQKAQEIEVPTITLTDLLDAEKVGSIDYLSIDIELEEPKALAGFEIDRFRPELVGIEIHPEVRQQIIDYFARHHYIVVGKYLRADVNNLYFTPMRAPAETSSTGG
jgi:FkbM family methyltransferase